MNTMPSLELLQKDFSINTEKLIKANIEQGFPDLDPKHKAFAYNYVATLNHRDAATESGFPAARGIQVLRDPLVNAMIGFLQDKMATRSIITREFVEAEMLALNDIAMGRVETKMVDKDGGSFSEFVHNLPVAKAVQTELAKSTKFYQDGSSQGGEVQISINLGALGVRPETAAKATVQRTIINGELADE